MSGDDRPDYVVCVRKGWPTPYKDNLEAACCACGEMVVFRPYMPRDLPKICVSCAMALAKAH